MKIRTLLIDSSYLLQRSFHGAKDTYTQEFGHCGALYQFLTTTRKLVKDHMINRVVLVWDGEGGGLARHNIDADYKANRKSKEWHKRIEMSQAEIDRENDKKESILKQRLRVQAYAEDLFLRQIEVPDIEADDLIAEYCVSHNNTEEIFIYSKDKDFFQLLDLNITILYPSVDTPINKGNFFFIFGYHYANALPIKIICGDTADNIKGIKGIGEDILLKYFPDMKYKSFTVREICAKADEINKGRLINKEKPLKALENLLNGVDRLVMNYKLTNLRKPFLNKQAREALLDLELPLSPVKRGSKNLQDMMRQDGFLSIYKGTFANYVSPFYVVIACEKERLEAYERNNKNK